ncbi:beta-1,3-glucan-binding protein-like isoform X2 [Condylostylus longicornis]|uniref:beta-1,3-glucan-binding protein-like isoform X2 n=1 Tax=Condylostylus longicornis TaxID=2530218 RepID=UPI00244E4BCD|nr:beta-1,3-glucan-binding protein-like isoform X2 [Condylostylus longicornis]
MIAKIWDFAFKILSLLSFDIDVKQCETGGYCSGELIFEENFDRLNLNIWQHQITLNREFQWYTNNRSNTYSKNGKLHIRPTLTADIYGEEFLSSGTVDLRPDCTDWANDGCLRTGNTKNIINPVQSGRIRTINSFYYKYGRIEVSAKMPAGDWLFPAVWLMPKENLYGGWPMSGEIDLVESRGNRIFKVGGKNIGTNQVGITLHFGPDRSHDAWRTSHFEQNLPYGQGYDQKFHKYEMIWTPDYIQFKLDDKEIGLVETSDGFYKRGKFPNGTVNIWENGEKNAPFDREFYVIINLAIGGTSFFSDSGSNPGGKPWKNKSPYAITEFWNGRNQWLPTWDLYNNKNENPELQVDYVRVYAL